MKENKTTEKVAILSSTEKDNKSTLTEKEENGIMAISEEPSETAEATSASMSMRCVDGNSDCGGSNDESCGGDSSCRSGDNC